VVAKKKSLIPYMTAKQITRSNLMSNPEALSVVNHRPLVLAGLAAVDYMHLGPLSEHRS